MIPRIDNLNEFPHFTTTDGVSGVVYKINSFDLESSDLSINLKNFQSWISSLDPHVLVRVITKADHEDFSMSQAPRAHHLEALGATSFTTVVVLEVKARKLSRLLRLPDNSLEHLREASQSLKNCVEVEPCSQPEISRFFVESPNEYVQHFSEISKGCLLYTSPSPRDS